MESELQRLTECQEAENIDEDILSNNVIGTNWILTVKPDGRFKARILVQGFRDKLNLKASEVYLSECSGEGERNLLGMVNEFNWDVHTIDVRTAYLQSNIRSRDVYIHQPRSFEVINSKTGMA